MERPTGTSENIIFVRHSSALFKTVFLACRTVNKKTFAQRRDVACLNTLRDPLLCQILSKPSGALEEAGGGGGGGGGGGKTSCKV